MLIDDGQDRRATGMSLAAMIEYFKQHPNEVDHTCGRIPRFVFFQIGDRTRRAAA